VQSARTARSSPFCFLSRKLLLTTLGVRWCNSHYTFSRRVC
jgi:hypothetical protein